MIESSECRYWGQYKDGNSKCSGTLCPATFNHETSGDEDCPKHVVGDGDPIIHGKRSMMLRRRPATGAKRRNLSESPELYYSDADTYSEDSGLDVDY